MNSLLCFLASGVLLGIPAPASTADQTEQSGATHSANSLSAGGQLADLNETQNEPGSGRIGAPPEVLEGTQRLTLDGDVASQMVAGADRFLLRELERSEALRDRFWHRDYSSPEAYTVSVATNRARLAHILGVRDSRVRFQSPELSATLG